MKILKVNKTLFFVNSISRFHCGFHNISLPFLSRRIIKMIKRLFLIILNLLITPRGVCCILTKINIYLPPKHCIIVTHCFVVGIINKKKIKFLFHMLISTSIDFIKFSSLGWHKSKNK